MSRGSLKCCGSPLYLKSKYGSGYNLILTRKRRNVAAENIEDNTSFKDQTDKIISLLNQFLPNAKLNSNINSEISFILPTEESGKFPQLFAEIEKNKNELGILNVGISVTTVEEVFLK